MKKKYTVIHFDSYGEVFDRYDLSANDFHEAFMQVFREYQIGEVDPEAYADAIVSFACCQYQEGDINFLIVEL